MIYSGAHFLFLLGSLPMYFGFQDKDVNIFLLLLGGVGDTISDFGNFAKVCLNNFDVM